MPGVKNESLELAELCNKGFQERLKEGHYDGMDLKEVTDRITYELQNIIEKGYEDISL